MIGDHIWVAGFMTGLFSAALGAALATWLHSLIK